MKKQILFQKDFTLVVIGQIISLFGNAILRFALPLYLLRETGSPSLFGAVTACSFIPMIIFSLFGGVLADRVNKRNIMVILDFGTAAIIAVFYLIHGILPIVPIMIVCLMLLYSISGAYQPAVQASIPALLENEQIMRGKCCYKHGKHSGESFGSYNRRYLVRRLGACSNIAGKYSVFP